MVKVFVKVFSVLIKFLSVSYHYEFFSEMIS